MIKCFGYLKLLKQYLFTLLISCFIFGLGSSVNATYQEVGLNSSSSSLNNDYLITVIRKGGFITNYLGVSKSILGFNTSTLFFWDSQGLPYLYLGNLSQGNFKRYYLCDYFSNGGTVFDDCSDYIILDNISSLSNFFTSITDGDIFYYDLSSSVKNICWSSQSFNKSLCFHYENRSSLENGRGYSGLTFSNLDSSLYSTYPFGIIGGNNNSQGSSSTEITIGLTGDYTYTSCTQGEILGMLENQGFSKYMCYGGIDNFDLWSSSGSYFPVPGTGKRLSQILSYSSAWDSPQQWFEYWYGLYQDKDNPLYYTMWESYPAVYRTWFDMYSKYGNGKYFDSIREYCVMKVDLTLNPDLVYNGTQFKGVCDSIIDVKQNPQYYTTDSGGRIVGVNWVGVGHLSGNSKTATQFIQDFFNTIKSHINTDYDGPGFIPAYIILFMLALIFFRFLSH